MSRQSVMAIHNVTKAVPKPYSSINVTLNTPRRVLGQGSLAQSTDVLWPEKRSCESQSRAKSPPILRGWPARAPTHGNSRPTGCRCKRRPTRVTITRQDALRDTGAPPSALAPQKRCCYRQKSARTKVTCLEGSCVGLARKGKCKCKRRRCRPDWLLERSTRTFSRRSL